MGALCFESVYVLEGNTMCACVIGGALCILLVLVLWDMSALFFFSVMRCVGLIFLLLPSMWYEVMSDEHSVGVCPPRVADLYFESVSVLVGTTALHISMNVG